MCKIFLNLVNCIGIKVVLKLNLNQCDSTLVSHLQQKLVPKLIQIFVTHVVGYSSSHNDHLEVNSRTLNIGTTPPFIPYPSELSISTPSILSFTFSLSSSCTLSLGRVGDRTQQDRWTKAAVLMTPIKHWIDVGGTWHNTNTMCQQNLHYRK